MTLEQDIARENIELKAENERLRNGLAIATRALERGRIWGGMGWKYQDMRADHRERTVRGVNAALGKKGGR